MDLTKVNEKINEFARLIKEKSFNPYEGELKVGVDLGTANIVLSVLDQHHRPIAGASCEACVVKDGIVVDYIGAVQIVKKLKSQLENQLGTKLLKAAAAIPPGILDGNTKAISNVVESSDMDVISIVDEPTAAATILGIKEGAVVDVGGGTTGISILEKGQVIKTADEPTGGIHMSLVLAGFYKIALKEAEKIKKDKNNQEDVFPIIRPVVEKMASIVKRHIANYSVKKAYIVGGACCFDDFEKVFEKELGIKVIKPIKPLLVTPLGIALHCSK